jgi:uncharacterized protein YndB with AHSA1/START domain
MESMPYTLTRNVVIRASRDTIFGYFTDSAKWANWWGSGSTIDPRPGGKMLIRHANGVEVTGDVLDVRPPERLVFTYGYASGAPIPPGSSRVTITLANEAGATRLTLTHDFRLEQTRDEHIQGWRYQLSVFGNLVANDQHRGVESTIDAWFTAWCEPDDAARRAALAAIASPGVRFGDRFSLVEGLDDLTPHIGGFHTFMSGMRIARTGPVRHCQGTVLAAWTATGKDGRELGKGTNVFEVSSTGQIVAVKGFWD